MNSYSVFEAIGTPIECRKGDLLFKQGDMEKSIYLTKSGLLKAYYLTSEGKEFVKSFIQEGELIGSLVACSSAEPSTFSLMCLEDSSLLQIPFADLQSIAANNAEFSNTITKVLIGLAMKKERREFEFLCLSAQERYALFKQRTPNLIDQVTQNDIARYLGITPVALSRIKQRENA
ncbi:MAG: Crp/Fnr family transcriptional regulator [Arenicella sp.]